MESKFETGIKSTLSDEVSITENGAVGYKTTGTKLLDLNFAVSSLRAQSDDAIVKLFSAAFYEDPKLAVKWLFFARDCRKGMGERRLFRVALKWLASVRKEYVKAVLPLIMEYGRADDMLVLSESDVWNDVIELIDTQISRDYGDYEAGKPISLLAKWLPSANTSSAATRALATKVRQGLKLSEKEYRKLLSKLRAKLNVIETKTSANKWNEIDYNAVPSQANMKYKNSFLRHDEARRREWLGKLEKCEAGVKINAGTLTAADIVHQYCIGSIGYGWGRSNIEKIDQTLEAAWKALPTTFDSTRNVIAVVDGSGSMKCQCSPAGNMLAHDVANGLGIYFSERLNGPFKDKFITFSGNPAFVDLSACMTLAEKISETLRHNECSNTDIEKTMHLVLETAVRNGLKQEEIPDLLILSDMEFDQGTYMSGCGCSYYGARDQQYSASRLALFENIKKEFQSKGYQMPKITFWNICGRSGTIPVKQNDLGVSLVSGFSQNIMQMVMSNKADPFDVLVEQLNTERYAAVGEAIKDIA